MTEPNEVKTSLGWNEFLRKHSAAFTAFIAAAILAAIGAVYVFVWFTANAQSTGLVPSSLATWTMANLVFFILNAIFWELILIGIPAAIGAIIGWQWWRRVPEQEKQQYHLSGNRSSKSRNAGGAVSSLLFIAFAAKVYVDGNWNQAISSYTLDYVVGSMVTILIWIAVIFAIPAIIGLVWWIRYKTKKV